MDEGILGDGEEEGGWSPSDSYMFSLIVRKNGGSLKLGLVGDRGWR